MVKSETHQDTETTVYKSKTETVILILDSETERNMPFFGKRDFGTHLRGFRDFEMRSKVMETQDFHGTSHHNLCAEFSLFMNATYFFCTLT